MLDQVDNWLTRFVPDRCVLCGLNAATGMLCAGCSADLPWILSGCSRCSAPLPAGAPAGACAGCDLVLRGIDRVRAALVYDFPVDSLVAAAKFRGRVECARVLGDLLARSLTRDAKDVPGCDLVVPVPLHPDRFGRRGYNQASIIGRAAARATASLLDTKVCARRLNTPPQSGMAGGARRANVRGAFAARRDLEGLTIALVDDVITTGHTVSALAVALRRAGAAGVEAWCAARVVAGQAPRKM